MRYKYLIKNFALSHDRNKKLIIYCAKILILTITSILLNTCVLSYNKVLRYYKGFINDIGYILIIVIS